MWKEYVFSDRTRDRSSRRRYIVCKPFYRLTASNKPQKHDCRKQDPQKRTTRVVSFEGDIFHLHYNNLICSLAVINGGDSTRVITFQNRTKKILM